MDKLEQINHEIEVIDKKYQAIEKICKQIEQDPDVKNEMKSTVKVVRAMNEEMETKKQILLKRLDDFKKKVMNSTGQDLDEVDIS